MSKAFDMVKWKQLFETLSNRGLSPIFVRLLIYMYTNQQYTVKWGDQLANYFGVKNGVRQGGVSSGIFFVVYIDNLIEILRKSGFGCKIFGVFLGVMIYADDIMLLSASRTGLQQMVTICQDYASKMNLKFGTNIKPEKSKTKCMIFSKKGKSDSFKEIVLDGNALPWVNQVKHLGHTLQADTSMNIDVTLKRGAFIGKINSLLQEFHYAAPHVLIKFMQTYACNLYGSNTWDLFSNECQKLYRSYNVAIRNMLKLPRTTHRYLIEPISEVPHLYVQLLSRYVTFAQNLLGNDAFEIRFLAKLAVSDMRTTLGKTIARIKSLCNIDRDIMISSADVKKNILYADVPSNEIWRLGVIRDLMKMSEKRDSRFGF